MVATRTQRRAALMACTALVWTAAILNSSYKIKLAAKAAVSVLLTTKPEAILVSVDGEKQFDGAYVQTPIKLGVAPGKRRIKIARDGYIAHVVSVEGDSGEQFKMDDVVLQKNPDATFARLIIESAEASVYIEIDDGLVRGDTPLLSTDLLSGAEHHLTVYPRGKGVSDSRWRCKFTPPAEGEGGDYTIKLKTRGDQVKAAGCEKIVGRSKKTQTP